MEDILRFLKCISDQTRLKMLKLFLEDEFCVCQLTAVLEKSQSSISQHLSYFKKLNLVKEKKDGKWTYYTINRNNYDKYLSDLLSFSTKTFEELGTKNLKENLEIVRNEDVCETRKKLR